MKKSFYYLSLILGLVFGMTMFTACGGDDEENGGSSGGVESGFVPGKFMGPKRVFGDNLMSSFATDSKRYELTYNSDNFVTKVKVESLNGEEVTNTREYEVTYSDKQVTINRTRSGSERVRQYTFTIGNNGFAESFTERYLDGNTTDVTKIEYDADGHMTKMIYEEENDEPWSGAFTWKDGNIIEASWDNSSINYTYTDINNVTGLFLRANVGGLDDLYLPEFYYIGLFGKGTANLVHSYNDKYGVGENAWTLDDAGRPIKCVTTITESDFPPRTSTYYWSYK